MEQNVNIVPKDEWVSPQLICLGRGNPDETVVLLCGMPVGLGTEPKVAGYN